MNKNWGTRATGGKQGNMDPSKENFKERVYVLVPPWTKAPYRANSHPNQVALQPCICVHTWTEKDSVSLQPQTCPEFIPFYKETLRRTRKQMPRGLLSLPSLGGRGTFKIICKQTRHTPACANTHLSNRPLPANLRNFLFACAIT